MYIRDSQGKIITEKMTDNERKTEIKKNADESRIGGIKFVTNELFKLGELDDFEKDRIFKFADIVPQIEDLIGKYIPSTAEEEIKDLMMTDDLAFDMYKMSTRLIDHAARILYMPQLMHEINELCDKNHIHFQLCFMIYMKIQLMNTYNFRKGIK